MKINKSLFLILSILLSISAYADEVEILDVRVKCGASCSFDVTLKHEDTGWDHYANQWDVISPDGDVLGTRVLYHPHVNEQPFTRSLSGVKIPSTINHVTIQARDTVHGVSPNQKRVDLPRR